MSDTHTPNSKVILLGNASVGKTSLIVQFYKSIFQEESQPTIGAAYISKVIETSKGKINLNIWDTAGQERFKSIIPMYLRGSHAVIFVCSPDDKKSVDDLTVWEDLLSNNNIDMQNVKGFVVLNKIDLCESGTFIKPTFPKQFALDSNYKYFETSAKAKTNVIELFNEVALDVADTVQNESNNVDIVQQKDEKETKKNCC